jgi:WD40 repeat protein
MQQTWRANILLGKSATLEGTLEGLKASAKLDKRTPKAVRSLWIDSWYLGAFGALACGLMLAGCGFLDRATHVIPVVTKDKTDGIYEVSCAKFSPKGDLLSFLDDSVRLFRVPSGDVFRTLRSSVGEPTCFCFSPNGEKIAIGSSKVGLGSAIQLVDLGSAGEFTLPGDDPSPIDADNIYALAFSPDGKILASGSSAKVCLWDLDRRRILFRLRGHSRDVEGLAFSPDGSILASAGGQDGTVRLWESKTGRPYKLLSSQNSFVAKAVAFAPNGELCATAYNSGHVIMWNVATGAQAARLRGSSGACNALAYSPDGRYLGVACGEPSMIHGPSSAVEIWDTHSKKIWIRFRAHRLWTTAIAFSPDGQYLATGSYGGGWAMWKLPGK